MKSTFHSCAFISSLLVGFVIACAGARSLAADSLSSEDKSFIKSAYEDGLAEIKVAELAQTKSANADVKAFATKMVTDHSNANAELKTLADSKKVNVASSPSMVAEGKSKLLDLKSGADFDKAFVDDMVSDHKKAVQTFEKVANEAKDADVKAFAAKTLPTLRQHLEMVQDLQAKVGK